MEDKLHVFDEKLDIDLHNKIRLLIEDYVGVPTSRDNHIRKCVDLILVEIRTHIKNRSYQGDNL